MSMYLTSPPTATTTIQGINNTSSFDRYPIRMTDEVGVRVGDLVNAIRSELPGFEVPGFGRNDDTIEMVFDDGLFCDW